MANYPAAKKWPQGRMLAWLKWAEDNGFLAVIMDYHKPIGLLFAKPVSDIPRTNHSYEYDMDGDTLYINFAIAKDKEMMRMLGAAALNNLGMRKNVAYRRNGKLRVHDMKKTLTALFRNV